MLPSERWKALLGTVLIGSMLAVPWGHSIAGRARVVCGDGNIQGSETCEKPGQVSTCVGETLCDRTCHGCRPPVEWSEQGRDIYRLCLDRGYDAGVSSYSGWCGDGFSVRVTTHDLAKYPPGEGVEAMCGSDWWELPWFTTSWTCALAERVCDEEGHGGVEYTRGESGFVCADGRSFRARAATSCSQGRPAKPFNPIHCRCGDPATCGCGLTADEMVVVPCAEGTAPDTTCFVEPPCP